ncbi:MAG: hypothetical protein M1818_001081 [Claussenomyces sp. TS43310]|nr:MAG: hypothetical protein M1818_001081 [Claussenomyces sp. TS43310]
MKPIVGVMQAWSCIIISVFAVVILTTIGILFQTSNHSMMSGNADPADGKAVAATVFGAVVVYAVFIVFCGLQALLHYRDSRRGTIALS